MFKQKSIDITPILYSSLVGRLVGSLGFKGSLRQYLRPYPTVCHRERKKKNGRLNENEKTNKLAVACSFCTGLATYFRSPSAFLRRAVVSYWRKYVHKVLVNRLGGLSLPRKSVVRLTDRPDMTLDVYRGRKTTIQRSFCKHCHYTKLDAMALKVTQHYRLTRLPLLHNKILDEAVLNSTSHYLQLYNVFIKDGQGRMKIYSQKQLARRTIMTWRGSNSQPCAFESAYHADAIIREHISLYAQVTGL